MVMHNLRKFEFDPAKLSLSMAFPKCQKLQGANRLPWGYDEEFVNEVEDELLCSICHLPLKKPVLTRCGHRFCKDCLKEHFRSQGVQNNPFTCPADREGLDEDRDVFPDKATERKILSLAIKCLSKGCDWTGELRSKEVHLASCLFKFVSCTNENCRVTVQRKDLQDHVTKTCTWSEHCGEPLPECQMKNHIDQCSKFPLSCPNSCGGSFPREMIPNHVKKDCPMTMILCPYIRVGCQTKIQWKQVESHLQSSMRFHLDLAYAKLIKTEAKLNDTEETTKKLVEKLDTLQRRCEEKVFNESEEKTVMVKKEPNFLRMFVWKIEDFGEKYRKLRSGEGGGILESAPFYTTSYGYKLMVYICPDDDDTDEDTHLSVFFNLMKGEYDAILPWPFENKVNFTLIDQQEDPDEQENISTSIIPDNDPKCFARPTKTKLSCGRSKFISHERLHSRRYLVDDTVFLQVEIGP